MEPTLKISDILRNQMQNDIDGINAHINSYTWVDDLPAILLELPSGHVTCSNAGGSVYYYLPLDKILMGKVKKALTDIGWTMNSSSTIDSQYFYNANNFNTVYVHYESYQTGATCKKIVIGEETYTRHVYEIVCNDLPANEELF